MKRRIKIAGGATLLASLLLVAYSMGRARAAGIPQTGVMSYSGTLLSYGQPDNKSHTIVLKVWAGSTLGCTTTPSGPTQVTNGRFSIPLDDSCLPVIHQNPSTQVEVIVDGTSLGLSPLTAVPYAVEADTASNPAPGSTLDSLVPTGTVIAFAGSNNGTAPAGWLFCDGSAVSRTQYAKLFTAIGTTHGAGDGTTTFNLPDYRGRFLRGVDSGAGHDPDAASRSTMAAGGNSGDAVGTLEGGQLQNHSHGVNDPGHVHGTGSPYSSAWLIWNRTTVAGDIGVIPTSGGSPAVDGQGSMAPATTGISIQATGGSETRPANASVNYLIKY